MKSRKERFAYLTMVVVATMGFVGVLTEQSLSTCIMGVFVGYMGGNVGEHFANKGKPSS